MLQCRFLGVIMNLKFKRSPPAMNERFKKCVTPINLLAAFYLLGHSSLALAYVGPGLGVGVIATVLGIASGLLMLLVGVIWYPLKKLVRRLRSKK